MSLPQITCPKCGGYMPGHASGSADICQCEPIFTGDTDPQGFHFSDKCQFCGEYGKKARPYVCERCWTMAVELVANTALAQERDALREQLESEKQGVLVATRLIRETADERDRLTAERDRLRAALTHVEYRWRSHFGSETEAMVRTALAPTQKEEP